MAIKKNRLESEMKTERERAVPRLTAWWHCGSATADLRSSGLCSVQSVGSFVFVSCGFKRGLGTFTDRLKEDT